MFKLGKALFLMCIASVFLGAAGTTLFAQSNEYAYVTVGNTVSMFSIDQATGTLTAVPGSPIQGGGAPIAFQLDPTHRFAYALLSSFQPYGPYTVPPSISAYTIDLATGTLTVIPGAPFGAPWTPLYLAVAPRDNFAYVVDYGGDYSNFSPSLLTYRIDEGTGALAKPPGRSSLGMPPQNTPGVATIDPAAQFLYMVSCPPPRFGGEGPCAEPSFIYAYTIDHNGEVKPVPGSPYSTGQGRGLAMAVNPTGQFLYLNSGAAYAIDGTSGALTPVPGSPFPVGGRGIAVDPRGDFVYMVGCNYQQTCVERIDQATGALTPVPGSPFQVGGDKSITVDATGQFIYMPNSFNCYPYSCIAAATVDRTTGALTPVPGAPFQVQQAGTASPVSIIAAPNQFR
jgi:DNA-binding beta-propeller fold protein YncE